MNSRESTLKKILRGAHFSGLLYGLGLLVLVHMVGTLGYMFIGYPTATWIDSFYFTFITVATIGFGETVDLSTHPMGRLFTVFIAIVGIGAMSYLFSTLVALLVESDLNTDLRKRRMEKSIAKLTGHFVVCGIGRVGTNVANELLKTRRKFVVIEPDRHALDRWLEHEPGALYLHGDAADDDALRFAGVKAAAGVFAVTGDDSHNLMISLSVKLLNPKARVVARMHDIRNAAKARRAGADEVVFLRDDGFVTEGCITNVFVVRNAVLLTPPAHLGLLPGVLRQSLLDQGRAREAELRVDDLANGFLIGNALRGLIPARLLT